MLKFTRAAAIVELNGEVLILNLSRATWLKVLKLAAAEHSGELVAAPVKNQRILDDLA